MDERALWDLWYSHCTALIFAKQQLLEERMGLQIIEGFDLLPLPQQLALMRALEDVERDFANAETTTVWQKIGFPDLVGPTVIESNELPSSIAWLLSKLREHNIVVEFAGDVDLREQYCYLVEDLLHATIQNSTLAPTRHYFTYPPPCSGMP